MNQSLCQWLSYIEGLHAQTIALGLERIQLVAQKLKVLAFDCPIITVAGTNGKGSCVAFLERIYTAAGYTVGTYTSPHLLRFNERIRIDGVEVTDLALITAFEQVEKARDQVALTYFEFGTLAALLLLQAAKLDVVVLEVGLGGRLDAVNLLDADMAIISSIALDHMDWLGDNREAIGYEKAGIFRAQKPAICGDPDPPRSILEMAQRQQSPLYYLHRDYHYQLNNHSPGDQPSWLWESEQISYTHLPIPNLPLQNAATALMAISCLQPKLAVSAVAIRLGLEQASLQGRFQQLYKPRQLILDVAHNPAAADYLAQRLQACSISGSRYAVVSILADKDREGTLKPLLPLVDKWYVGGLALARGSSAETMANCLHSLGVPAYHIRLAESVTLAFQLAIQEAQTTDQIVVYGSFHTVAAVLQSLQPAG